MKRWSSLQNSSSRKSWVYLIIAVNVITVFETKESAGILLIKHTDLLLFVVFYLFIIVVWTETHDKFFSQLLFNVNNGFLLLHLWSSSNSSNLGYTDWTLFASLIWGIVSSLDDYNLLRLYLWLRLAWVLCLNW